MNISVIIPTFNRLWCLPQTIDSARKTECETEIIVVDDGSTDGTMEWLQTQKDVIAIQQENQGKCWAVNKGLSIAKGKYIRFLDSDDIIMPTANDIQFTLAESEKADIVVAGHNVINRQGTIINEIPWTYCDDFIAQQLGECDSSHYSAYLFKRDFIKEIPHRPDFAYRDDRMLVIETAITNPKVAIYNNQTFGHRKHESDRLQFPEGLKQSVQNFQHLAIYKRVLKRLQDADMLTQRRKNAACNILWPLAHWIAKTHLKEAVEVVKWIYELNPDFKIPDKGSLGWMYANMGFEKTERILKYRRLLKYGFN